MPYLKFSRDKRGYENFFLIEGKPRPRVLFWFRTPPNVKVGRMPFSDDVRQMIEAQNPDLTFDWARITSTPIPSPDADHWRERRRAEKAARRAAREEETAVDEAEAQPIAVAQEATAAPEDVDAVLEAVESSGAHAPSIESTPAEAAAPASESQATGAFEHRRRRRRRRRRGHGQQPAVVQPGTEAAAETATVQQDAAPPDEAPPSDEV